MKILFYSIVYIFFYHMIYIQTVLYLLSLLNKKVKPFDNELLLLLLSERC